MHKFLPIIIVFVAVVAICTVIEAESKAVFTRDYGVKLCGREFIRAVIFTCGGSRWKRSGQVDSLLSSDRHPSLMSPNSDLLESRDMLSWRQNTPAALDQPQKLSPSLADLLKEQAEFLARPDQNEKPQWGSRWNEGAVVTLGGTQKIPWPHPNRQKRNFSLGLAGMCCNRGCTKNDIGRLC